ncbi:hypothetical protein HDU76_005621 [Blyttiomyces sp. JEL0837]|nr:hypothetical protein HDU76_005621 [Blyttiomyces sp. JEL0837]
MPTPKSTQLFQKAFVLYNLICHEDFRFRNPLCTVDRDCLGRISILVPTEDDYKFNDILPAIQEYVRWFKDTGPRKWSFIHPTNCSCVQTVNGVSVAGLVFDGKVMALQSHPL